VSSKLEAVEAAFDDVVAPVGDTVEGRWAATGPAAAQPVGSLIPAFGNGRRDVPSAQILARCARRRIRSPPV